LATGRPGLPASTPGNLGTTMVLSETEGGVGSTFTLDHMTNNLSLIGNNDIRIESGSTLSLSQHVTAAGDVNNVGGVTTVGQTGVLAVEIKVGGTLNRPNVGGGQFGVPDSVRIGGVVYNYGGTLLVGAGETMRISGFDNSNYSYWQNTDSRAILRLESGANLNAGRTFEIDAGLVQLTAPSGGSADELDGTGLTFGNANRTALTVVDSTPGSTGAVTITGPVTLAANTTTTLNYKGGNNATADLLDVKNGALTLDGTLNLLSGGSGKPANNVWLNFLDDTGAGPTILNNFATFTGDIPGATYANQQSVNNPQQTYYQVKIT
jgi:hypothetical protein